MGQKHTFSTFVRPYVNIISPVAILAQDSVSSHCLKASSTHRDKARGRRTGRSRSDVGATAALRPWERIAGTGSNRRAWSSAATEARNPAGRREAIRTYVRHMGSDVPKGLCGAAHVGP